MKVAVLSEGIYLLNFKSEEKKKQVLSGVCGRSITGPLL